MPCYSLPWLPLTRWCACEKGVTAAHPALEGAHVDARGYLNQKQSMKVLYNHPTGTARIWAKALCCHWKKNLHQCCLHNCKPACICVSPAPEKQQGLVRGPHLPKENNDTACAESCQVHTSQTPEHWITPCLWNLSVWVSYANCI